MLKTFQTKPSYPNGLATTKSISPLSQQLVKEGGVKMMNASRALGACIPFVLFFFPFEATARCQCTCVNGSLQAVCSSAIDLPPICAPTICPIAPPSVRPIDTPRVPPIGATYCQNEQVLNPVTGRYEWRQICR